MTEIHGDPTHSCYDDNGNVVCVVAKAMLNDGPSWRDLKDVPETLPGQHCKGNSKGK